MEPTREQERTAEAICEARGGWAQVSPPAFGGTTEVVVAGGDAFVVNPDGSYLDRQTNRLVEPEEEE